VFSNGHKDQLIAVLSLRKGPDAQDTDKGVVKSERGRHPRPQGFSGRDETFSRIVAANVGPALHLLVIKAAENRIQEAAVMQEESLQKVLPAQFKKNL
jgi:hypothetical protein